MTNKSEELAKLLGIELKRFYVICWIDCQNNWHTDETDKKEVAAAHIRLAKSNKKYARIERVEKRLPDFTKPSNFVRLIELQVSKKLIVGRYLQGSGAYGVPFSNQWYDRESFFNILTDYLSRTDKCFARNRNKIIYKAQQTEWEY